jgi:DNA repair exonuclease SbcCD ATPase subunit
LANIGWSEEMSVKLDELRRRLLQQEQPSDQNQPDDQQPQVLTYSPHREAVPPAPTPKEIAAPPIAPESAPQPEPQIPPPVTPRPARPREAAPPASVGAPQISEAVARVFEQTEAFQRRLNELRATFEPIERVGKAAADSFAPLSAFRDQLAQVGRSFEPMKTFQAQLADLAQTFEPMRALQDQLSQIADSFQLEIAQLANALETARLFRERIADLAKAFEPIDELDEGFRALRSSFQSSAQDGEGLAVEPQTAQAGLPN